MGHLVLALDTLGKNGTVDAVWTLQAEMEQLVLVLDTLGINGTVSVGFGHFRYKLDSQCWLWTLKVKTGQLVLALDT